MDTFIESLPYIISLSALIISLWNRFSIRSDEKKQARLEFLQKATDLHGTLVDDSLVLEEMIIDIQTHSSNVELVKCLDDINSSRSQIATMRRRLQEASKLVKYREPHTLQPMMSELERLIQNIHQHIIISSKQVRAIIGSPDSPPATTIIT